MHAACDKLGPAVNLEVVPPDVAKEFWLTKASFDKMRLPHVLGDMSDVGAFGHAMERADGGIDYKWVVWHADNELEVYG